MIENKYLNDYIAYIKYEKKLSTNTINSYILTLNKFYDYVKKNLNKIDEEDIKKYLELLNKSLSSRSINHEITILKEFFKYTSRKHNFNNPMKNFTSRKSPKTLPKYLTEDEISNLMNIKLENKFNYRDKAMLELMYAAGLRVGELLNLKINSVDINNCYVRVFGKGNKERIVPISDISIKYLNIYVNECRNKLVPKNSKYNDYIFLNNHGKKLSRVSFLKIIKKQAIEVGIKKEVSPHILRHSFATNLITNGADIRSVQLLLGHENITTTQIYTHLSNEFVKNSYFESNPRSKKEE